VVCSRWVGVCGAGGIKVVCQVAVGLLHEVCLSLFALSMCKRGFQAVLRIRPSDGLILSTAWKPQMALPFLTPHSLLPAFEDGTDTWFRNVGILHIDRRGNTQKNIYDITISLTKSTQTRDFP